MQLLLKISIRWFVTKCFQLPRVCSLLIIENYIAVESFGPVLKHQEVQVCSDSQNALNILEKGNRKDYLHELAMAVSNSTSKCSYIGCL